MVERSEARSMSKKHNLESGAGNDVPILPLAEGNGQQKGSRCIRTRGKRAR